MLKSILKKNNFFWTLAVWIKKKLDIFLRIKDVFMMFVLFHLFPGQVYRFSTRKLLPGKKNRFKKTEKSIIPYDLLKSKSAQLPRMKEINVVSPSPNFDLNNLKTMEGPIFMVTFWTPLKIDENGKIKYRHPRESEEGFRKDHYQFYWETGGRYWNNQDKNNSEKLKDFKKDSLTYVLSRKKPLDLFKKNGYNVLGVNICDKDKNGNYYPFNKSWEDSSDLNSINNNDKCRYISINQKIYKNPLEQMKSINKKNVPGFVSSGSFLPALCALSYFAEKINVYGWDFYLDQSPKNMKYLELFLNMYKYKNDLTESWNHFECALINFYYSYQISKLPIIKIHSNLGKLERHTKLINRIENVLFN